MFKNTVAFAVVMVFTLGVGAPGFSSKPASMAGAWQVDSRHSIVELTTDGTSDYGKTKINATLGVGRVNGILTIDDSDPTKSNVNVQFYPATSMSPPIEENGNFKARWRANLANHTLVGFHSKNVVRTPDGRLQATGELTLTRVDRNVEITPSEAYAGPVYGPPVIHRVSREATFVFDLPADDGPGQKHAGIAASASTKVFREDFPQLVMAVVSTYWPPVIQDEDCKVPSPSDAYSGAKCTGTFMRSPSLPEATSAHVGEDYPGPQDFNAIVGERLKILLRMRLVPRDSRESAAAGN